MQGICDSGHAYGFVEDHHFWDLGSLMLMLGEMWCFDVRLKKNVADSLWVMIFFFKKTRSSPQSF